MNNRKRSPWKTVIGSTIGNALEWYDFLIFGYLSVLIAKQFFPSDNPLTSILLTTATFGVGFIFRPLAGIWIGMYADRRGRKAALSFIILLMFISTAMLAFAPTYQQAGIWAPVIVVISRILQGISAGGEFGSATALLVELAPKDRKGFYGSWQMFAQAIGSFLATLAAAMLTSWFTTESLSHWAWRLPFIVGLVIGPVGYWIRRNIDESEEFEEAQKQPSVPFRELLTNYPTAMLISFALGGATNVMVYVLVGYLPIYAVHTLRLPINTPFIVLAATMPVRMLFVPFFGHLSDKVGRRRVMGYALVLFIALVYPAFMWLTHAPGLASLLAMELVFAIIMAAVLGPFAATAADLFPTGVRSTGMSLTYNLTAALLGGFSPFILTWLVDKTGDIMMPAHYMVIFLSLGALSLLCYRQGEAQEPTIPRTLVRRS
ncbi:MFS transporter [Paraburkholderia sp. GAS32]|uniref:MFS transporter n=1 Tax=Paraburkholderia sp. GAS32 TaxID=3035129 RepID=UPI003D261EC1